MYIITQFRRVLKFMNKNRIIVIFSILFVLLCSLSAVAASELNSTDAITSEITDETIGETADFDAESGKILTTINEEQESILNVTCEEQESVLDATEDESEEWGTFTELRQLISDTLYTKEIKLQKNYRSTGSGGSSDEIVINREVTIDGNGHTIDCAGKSTAFVLDYSYIHLKNMRITGFADTSKSHLYAVTVQPHLQHCIIENCIFEGNSYSVLSMQGTFNKIVDCVFRNNSANGAELVYLTTSNRQKDNAFHRNYMTGSIFVDNGKITSDGKFDTDKLVLLGDDFIVEYSRFENNVAEKGIVHFGGHHYLSTVNKCFFGVAETGNDYGLICRNGNVRESIFCTPDIKGNVINGVRNLDYNLWFDGTKSYEIPERVVESEGYGTRYEPYIVTGYEVVKEYELIILVKTYYVPSIPKEVRLGDTIQLKLMFLKSNTSLLQMPTWKTVTFQVEFSDSNLNSTNITFTNGISTPFNYTALDGEEGTATILYNGAIITSIKLKHSGEYDSFTLLKHAISKASNEIDLTHDYKFYSSLDDKIAFTVDKDITINGDGHTIDGCNGANGIFNFASGRNITVKNLNFVNFKGLVVNAESSGNDQITFINCTFKNIGGGIKSNKITVIYDCKFEDSTATAINLYSTQNIASIIDNSIFENCKSKYDGGAGYINSPTIITDSQFKNNYARNGGGLYIDAQNCAIDNCEFIGDKADYLAAGVYFNNTGCNLTNSLFKSNSAASNVPFYFKTTQGTVENNTETNNTISKNSFSDLKGIITSGGNVVNLETDYKFKYGSKEDSKIADGIPIEKNLIINGNGHTIDGDAYATFFEIYGKTLEVTFNNINFVNALCFGIYIKSAKSVSFNNCTFHSIEGQESTDAVIYIDYKNRDESVTDSVLINRCSFIYNDIYNIIFANPGDYALTVKDSVFVNPDSTYDLFIRSHNSKNYLDYNWWGNTEYNFTSMPKVNVKLNNWYFLNDTTVKSNRATISLNNLYDNVAKTVTEDANCSLTDVPVEFIGKDLVIDDAVIKHGILTVPYKTIKKPAFLTTVIYGINNTVNITEKGQFDMLQELIDNATGNIVNLNRDYTLTEDIDSVGGIIINKDNLIINGNGHTINALGISNLFNILSDNVKLMNLILINGNGTISQSSPIQWRGNYGTIENCTVSNNFAERFGAITWTGTMGGIINSTFNNNRGLSSGGAILIEGIGVSIINSNFTSNVALRGASIYSNNGYTRIDNCKFIKNDASDGGAVYLNDEYGRIRYSIFENNTGRYGGAIYCNDINDAITTSIFTFNNARYGGAVYWNKKYGSLADCEFANNTATEDGGAIYWNANYGTVDSSSFDKNTAKRGGAIYWDYDYGKVIDSIFIKNTANDGGAVYFCEGNFIKNEQQTVDYSIFLENSAQNNGGAIYVAAKKSTIGNSTFIKNQAKDGGALYATFKDGTISQSVFINNSASDEGSAIYTDEDSTPVNYCVFFEDNSKSIIYHDGSWFSSNLNADYNWWGNNITNFNQKLANVNDDVEVNNWYVLDMTMNEGTANITLNSLFENNKIRTDENCKMPQINITLTNENLTVADSIILGENGYVEVEYLPKAIKGSLKASFETSSVTRSEEFLPSSTTITTAEDEFIYGNITIEYEVINPTIINVAITNETGSIVFENLTSEYMVSPDLAAGTYTVTVTNMGNGSIVSSNDTKTFTVTKLTPTIMVVAEDVIYPGDVIVNVTSDVAGNYTVKIGNVAEEINLTVNEVKQLTFSGLKAQEYLINVTYDETGNHTKAFNDSVKVNVLKAASEIIIKNITYLDYWNVIVEIELVNSEDFTAKLYQNATEISKITKNQTAIMLNDLTLGDYTLNITTIADENHTQTTESVNIFVKYTPTINVATADVRYPDDVIVNVTSDATGKFTMKIGNNTLEFNLTEDVKTEIFRFKDLVIGEYAINVTYQGNEIYTAAFNDTVNVNVLKINTTVDSTVKIDGYHATITVNVNPNATGFVYLTYDDFACYLALENGSASINNTLPVGNYNASVKYLGDDLYNESSTTLEFVIVDPAKENTNITLKVESDENDVTYNVDVNPNATGLVKFEVTGTEEYTVYSDVINGKAILDDILDAGDYTIIATYMGDARFNTNITTQTFTIKDHEKQDTPIDANVNITGYRTTITVNVNPNATGFISIKLGDTIAHIALTNGTGSFITNLAAGSYHADLTYLGDDDFNKNSTAVTFTIVNPVKENTTISLEVISNETDVIYTVDVNSNATGLVKFEVTGTEEYIVYADIINGKVMLEDKLVVGNYTVIATYLGDSNYNTNVTSQRFSIKGHAKQNTTIDADVKINGYLATINVYMNPNATGFVKLTIKDSIIYLAVKNGVASVNNTLPAGSYNIAIKYLGDDNYNENNTTLEFVIVEPAKENTNITLNVESDENYVAYIVDVNSNATGLVKFEITGTEEYTVYADVINGKAILADILEAGDYTIIATYMGDARFNTNITTQTFTIKGHEKQDTTIDANVNINGYHTTITVNVNPNATGFVRIKLADTIANIELTDGTGSFVTSLAAGSYHADLTYLGDNDFNKNSTTLTFTIVKPLKENTPISLNISSNENDVIYTVDVNSNATGLVKFEVTGLEEYVLYADVIDGKAYFYDTLTTGDYTVVATYMGDDRFNTNITTESFTVKGHVKENTSIDTNANANGHKVTITVAINENATGFVSMKLGDNVVIIPLTDGTGSYVADFLAGSYSADLTYLGDDDFNGNATSVSFTVVDAAKENTAIAIDVITDEDKAYFTVTVDKDATGLVKFDLTGPEEYVLYADVIDGKAYFYDTLTTGDYTVVATYMGDDRFNTNITTESFTVKGHVKENTSIDTNANANGHKVTITVAINENATGFVSMKLGDNVIIIPLVDGIGTYTNDFTSGSYSAVLTYLGDDDFNENNTRVLFTVIDVAKENTEISVDVDVIKNDAVFTVIVDENTTGIVKFEITGAYALYVDVVDGKAVLEEVFENGDYTLVATYMGDDRFNTNVTSCVFTIDVPETEVTNATINIPTDIKAGTNATVDVLIPNATGNVTVIVDGKETVVPLVNGSASVPIENVTAGDHSVVVIYSGDETHAPTHSASSFSVPAQPVVIPKASEFSEITIGDDQNISIVLKDADGNVIANAPITYSVNGIAKTTTTDAEGKFIIAGENGAVIVIKYAGNEYIIGTNTTLTLNNPVVPVIVKVESRFNITGGSITLKGYAIDKKAGEKGMTYATELLDINGNPISNVTIQFAINDKIHSRVTYENGSFAPYELNMLRAGRYTLAFSFGGDDQYNSTFAVVCIDLDKKPIKIKASAKTYKTSAKTKKYTVTLSTIAGSSADGKAHLRTGLKVTMQINGKTYTGKTNSKGQVSFNIKITKKGKYTAKISYAGDQTYNSASKSVKITIN